MVLNNHSRDTIIPSSQGWAPDPAPPPPGSAPAYAFTSMDNGSANRETWGQGPPVARHWRTLIQDFLTEGSELSGAPGR